MSHITGDLSVGVTRSLFQVTEGGASPTRSLHFERINLREALSLNKRWHSRLPDGAESTFTIPPYVAFGAFKNDTCVGIAIWSHPIARAFNGRNYIELRRMALNGDHPNLASQFLAWMVRDIRKRFPDVVKCISYHDHAVHDGTIYKASGWVPHTTSTNGNWNTFNSTTGKGKKRINKARNLDAAPMTRKTRWEKDL